jgi:peptidoglycan/LPS O-acetylase OafA/YrhL
MAGTQSKMRGINLDRQDNDASFTLDLLRVVAAEMVCTFHAIAFFKVDWLRAPHLPPMQNFGVCIFFVLSGFLIAHTLTRKSENPQYGFPEYVIDRVARVYSGWIPALIFVAIADAILFRMGVYDTHRTRTLGAFIGNFLMLQQYAGAFAQHLSFPVFGTGGPFWTMSVEFHIYLFVGAAFFLLRGAKSRLTLIALLIFSQQAAANLTGTSLFILWLYGFAAAFILAECAAQVSSGIWLAIGSVSAAFLCWKVAHHDPFDPANYIWLAASFTALIALALRSKLTIHTSDTGVVRIVRFMANYSFSLYLIHYTIMYGATRFMTLGRFRSAVLMIVIANIVAAAIAIPTEMRHRRIATWLKSRLTSGRQVETARRPSLTGQTSE